MDAKHCEDCVYLLDDGDCEYHCLSAAKVENCEERCKPLDG